MAIGSTRAPATTPNIFPITFADSVFIDSFGRVRVSNPVNEFTSEFQYNLHPLYFDPVTANNGTISHNANLSAANLNVTTDNGSKAMMQTLEYFRYQPGKSLSTAQTFVMPSLQSGMKMQVGYFDDDNGFFFEINAISTVQFVRRTKTSGSVVDNVVVQSNWNHDKMDGTGESGVKLDFTKGQILRIDLQWLSFGRIRMLFDVHGVSVLAHEFLVVNVLSVPSTTTANLPLRWLIENTLATANSKTMLAICGTVYNEGGDQTELGHPFTGGNGVTTRSVSTIPFPICSIRLATTLNSITNRAKIRLESIEIITNQDLLYQLIYKPSSITNASFGAPVSHSGIQVDIAGTAIADGVIIHGGYISAGAKKDTGSGRVPFTSKLPISLDSAGTDQSRSVSIVLTRLTADATCAAQFNWTEVR